MKADLVQRLVHLSIDASRRVEAEHLAQELAGESEEIRELLHIVEIDSGSKGSLAAIFLKVSLGRCSQIDRDLAVEVVTRIIGVSMRCTRSTHLVLCDSVRLISRALQSADLALAVSGIEEGSYTEQTVRLLEIINAYFVRYQTEGRSDNLYLDILASVNQLGSILVRISVDLYQHKNACKGLYSALFEMFYSLICQDLPDYLENEMSVFLMSCMECCDKEDEQEALLQIKVLSVILERYMDAVEDPGVFVGHTFELLQDLESQAEEDRTAVVLKYITEVLRSPDIEGSITADGGVEQLARTLMGVLGVFEDAEEEIECIRAVFNSDLNLQREILSDLLKDIVEKHPELLQVALSNHAEYKRVSVWYLLLYIARSRTRVSLDVIAAGVEEAKAYLGQLPGLTKEEDENQLISAAGLVAVSIIHGKYPHGHDMALVNEQLLESVLKGIVCYKDRPRLVLVLAKLAETLCTSLETRSLSVLPSSRAAANVLVERIVQIPPNEFLAPALFEILRVAQVPLSAYLSVCSERLLLTMETSGNLAEAKGLWDVLSLSVLDNQKEGRQVALNTARECLEKDVADWYVFAIQLIALCALAGGDETAVGLVANFAESGSLWAVPELFESLCFCVVALASQSTEPKYLELVQHIFDFLSSNNDKNAFVLARYLPITYLVHLLAKTEERGADLSPPQYLAVLRAFTQVPEKSKQVADALTALLRQPIILEPDTAFFIDKLSLIQNEPFAASQQQQIIHIIQRLKTRPHQATPGHRVLSIINPLFELHKNSK
ncbi:hypothetical protein NEHOM01_0798 [Nematocida homosporus]|uniref:uncharacterized protein n=1 Tax=Nematocida homosporus TaxID=1912981 RepID=UPI00222053BE|nr:uncharacterized protein NEHOM01_0798 [Nematocida homosporus]KAI5185383.1 hypothetical protein NEHOM01_0798 [Nematocida homosporus]